MLNRVKKNKIKHEIKIDDQTQSKTIYLTIGTDNYGKPKKHEILFSHDGLGVNGKIDGYTEWGYRNIVMSLNTLLNKINNKTEV